MEWNRSRAKRTKPVVDFTASELVPIEGTRSVFSTCIEVDRTFTHVNVVSTSPEGPRLTGIFFAAGHTWIVQEDSTDLEAFARTCSRHARSVGREVVKATERRFTGASLTVGPVAGPLAARVLRRWLACPPVRRADSLTSGRRSADPPSFAARIQIRRARRPCRASRRRVRRRLCLSALSARPVRDL